jgi:predicted double-glycine peptidase
MNVKDLFSDNGLVIQQTSFTCGPVALLNALHLKGDFSRTEEELSKLCDAKAKFGTTEENLVKAARTVGLELVEEKSNATVEDIQRNIDNGAYVIICYTNAFSGNGHYTCVTEYDDRALYCRDPALGLLRLSKEYLPKFWHGSMDASRGSNRWYMAVK